MSYQDIQQQESAVSRAGLGDRAKFITKTYNHLLGAIFAFVANASTDKSLFPWMY